MSLCVKAKFTHFGTSGAPLGALVTKRDASSNAPAKGYRPELVKRGTGGRSSFNGIIATVFGCTGFLGRSLCNRLGKTGTMMVLPYRGNFYNAQRLKVAGDLGQVVFHEFSIRDEKSVALAMKYSSVVINMMGTHNATSNFPLKDINVDGARLVARVAREEGIEKLIHVSALNATEKPRRQCLAASKFYATKWEGEQAVRQEFPDATIIRPADMYGIDDNFCFYYGDERRRNVRVVPVWRSGKGIYKAPVFVSDVAKAIEKVVATKGTEGQIYQAVGPKFYELGPLVDYMFRVMMRGTEIGYVRYDMRFDPLFILKILLLEKLEKFPSMGVERVEREHTTDVVDYNLKFLTDLGIEPAAVEDMFPVFLKHFHYGITFEPQTMYFPRQDPPPSQAVL